MITGRKTYRDYLRENGIPIKHNLKNLDGIRTYRNSTVNYYEFRDIQESLPECYKMRIFIAYIEENPISAAVITTIGSTAIYMFAANNNLGLELKGAYLLQWNIINWLKDKGLI